MKKLILILTFIPFLSFSQTDSTKKIKFQYIQINITKEQYDTVMYSLLKTNAEFQTGVASLRIFKDQAQLINVYDTVISEPVKKKKK